MVGSGSDASWLPARVQPARGEAFDSFCRRLADANDLTASARLVRLVHLPRRDADSLHAQRRPSHPHARSSAGLMRSITWDQGTKMARVTRS